MALLYVCLTLFDDREGPQSQEVHLQHADFLDVMSVVLGHPYLFSSKFVVRHADRNIFGEIASSYDHCAGMNAGLTNAAFKLGSIIKHILHFSCTLFQLCLQFRYELVAVLQLWLVADFLLIFLELLAILFDEFLPFFKSVILSERFLGVLHLYDRLVRNHFGQPV